jgi:hypothetical protein
MSSAGQANEAGSVFRRDAAVHFAVHALAGAQVGSLPNASPVTRIDFETADPTDDIRVTHQDGTQFFISAKRAAGLDKPTKDTVADWVAQAPTLRPGDLLILAAAETTGTLKTLQNALDRARAGGDIRGDFGVKLKWLDDRVKPAKLRPIVRNRAHIVEFTRTPTNNTEQNLLVTMMNNLVEGHRGAAALDCLAAHLHTVAGLGSGSGVETWHEVLESKGFRLRPAAAGSAAVRYAKAVTGYRRALSKDQGIIDLSLLADDLDPLPKRDILDGIRINDSSRERSTNRPIVPVVRRKRRLLVLGQPGTRKSKALWEIAAHFAQIDGTSPPPSATATEESPPPRRCDIALGRRGHATLVVVLNIRSILKEHRFDLLVVEGPRPLDLVAADPVVRSAGALPTTDRRMKRDRFAVVGEPPLRRLDGCNDPSATTAGAEVRSGPEARRYVEVPPLEGLWNRLDELGDE